MQCGHCVRQDQSWVAVTPLSGRCNGEVRSPKVVLAGGHLVPAADRGQMWQPGIKARSGGGGVTVGQQQPWSQHR